MFRSQLLKTRLPAMTGLAIGAGVLAYSMSTAPKLRNESLAALDPKQWTPLHVKSTKQLSEDTKEIVLSLPEDHNLGGKTAYCVMFKFNKDGKNIIRPYTPVSAPEQEGYATFVIKRYPDGAMSQHVHTLESGDALEVKGPFQKIPITTNKYDSITLVGGGTGITPLYQVLHEISNDPKDTTKVKLLYGSKTPQDILLKTELDALVAKNPKQFSVDYFVDKATGDWKGKTGFISKDVLAKEALGKPTDSNTIVLVCGPPGFMDAVSGNKKSPSDQGELTGALKELGYKAEQVFKF